MAKRIIFRDSKGRFVKNADRYTKATMVQAVRRHLGVYEYIALITEPKGNIAPRRMADVLTVTEFESLPETYSNVKDVKMEATKYKAWEAAGVINRMKGVRRKPLRVVMQIREGQRLKEVVFYTTIKANRSAQYNLFRRMNQAIGQEGHFLYDRVGSKLIADRKGTQATLENVIVQEVL